MLEGTQLSTLSRLTRHQLTRGFFFRAHVTFFLLAAVKGTSIEASLLYYECKTVGKLAWHASLFTVLCGNMKNSVGINAILQSRPWICKSLSARSTALKEI